MKLLTSTAAIFLIFGSVIAQIINNPSDILGPASEISIIPMPNAIIRDTGKFTLDKKTVIVAKDPAAKALAEMLNGELKRRFDITLKVAGKMPKSSAIIFDAVSDGADGWYSLKVEANSIKIGGSASGRFYALQSLYQMMPLGGKGAVEIQRTAIADVPRFKYRGMHLDVSRHFFPVDEVKRYIDQMSRLKLNVFHWHLTDDQGWRIEIKKYPKLTEIGSKRSESHQGTYSPIFKGDGIPVEGFYTQDQIKDVVAYAKARYITVIPEIELPGHASAALAAYPEFGCKTDFAYNVQKTWGIFKETYCPTEATFKFLEDVIDETIKLFPDSPYVHIGGDEVLKDHWKESAFVQELKKKENLKDEHEVQSFFVRRMEKFINSKGKKIIGWDEILEGGVAPNATIMSWRGMKGGIEAAKAHHDVIMTPNDYVYLDYGQGDPAYEPLNIGSYVPLKRVYEFDPVPKELSKDEAKYIIGGQANIWTEYIPDAKQLEYMAFPRMLALAEDVWTMPGEKNYDDFMRRVEAYLPTLDTLGINYRIPEPDGLQNVVTDAETAMITLKPMSGTKVLYTLDGSTPDDSSPAYSQPIAVELKDNETKTLKTVVVLATGRKSVVYAATIIRGKLYDAENTAASKPGLNYLLTVPSADGVSEPKKITGETQGLALQQFGKQIDLKQNFAVQYDGFIKVPADGVYELQVDSTWGVTAVLGGQMIIDSQGTAERKLRSGVAPLKAGLQRISIRYDHRGGDPSFRIRFGQKGQGLRVLYGGEFVH